MKIVLRDKIFATNNNNRHNCWQPDKFKQIEFEGEKFSGNNKKEKILNHFGDQVGRNGSPYTELLYQNNRYNNLYNSCNQIYFRKNICLSKVINRCKKVVIQTSRSEADIQDRKKDKTGFIILAYKQGENKGDQKGGGRYYQQGKSVKSAEIFIQLWGRASQLLVFD